MAYDTPPQNRVLALNSDNSVSTLYPDGDKPAPGGGAPELQVPDGGIDINVTGCTVDWRTIFTAKWRGQFCRWGHVVLHQGIGAEVASMRQETYNTLVEWRENSIPGADLLLHKLFKYMAANETTASDGKKYQFNAVWRQPGWDGADYLLKRNGGFVKSEPAGAIARLCFKMGEPIASVIAKELVEDWSDTDGSRVGQYDMLNDPVRMQYMSDSQPELNDDRFGEMIFSSGVKNVAQNNQIDLDRWSYDFETGQTPDADGFYPVPDELSGNVSAKNRDAMQLIGITGNRRDVFGGFVTGIKHINVSTTRFRWDTRDVKDGYYGSTSDTVYIQNGNRSGYTADFNFDGNDDSPRGYPALALEIKDQMLAIEREWNAKINHKMIRVANFLNASEKRYRNDANHVYGADNPYFGFWDIPTSENFSGSLGMQIFDGTGCYVRGVYDPDIALRTIELGKLYCDLSVWRPTLGPGLFGSPRYAYPFTRLDWSMGGPQMDNYDKLDAAYEDPANARNPSMASMAKMGLAMGLVNRHVGTSITATSFQRNPWWCFEQFIHKGWPVDENGQVTAAAEQARVMGTYDPSDDTIVWTPTFGTHGFVVLYEHAAVVWNGASDGQHYLDIADGTVGDIVTIGGVGLQAYSQSVDGKTVYFPDTDGYVVPTTRAPQGHPWFGLRPGTLAGVLNDPNVNTGAAIPATFRCPRPGGYILPRY